MSKINIGSRYVNSRNGRIAVLAKQDSRTGNLTLMYEEISDDGKKGLDVTKPTFNRWWKLLEDEQPVVEEDETTIVMQQKKELGIECPPIDSYEVVEQNEEVAGDGTPYTQVMQEIVADAKTRSKKTKEEKKAGKKVSKDKKVQEEGWVTESLTYIFSLVLNKNDEIFTPAKEGMKMRTFKTGGHMYAKLNYSSKSITLAVQSVAVSDTNPTKKINHMFDNGYVFTSKFSAADRNLISKLLKEARNYRIQKNSNKVKEEK